MSIRKKLILALLVFATVPMITMEVLGFFGARNSLKDSRIAGLESTADLKADQIEAFLQERKSETVNARRFESVRENLPILIGLAGHVSNPEYIKAKADTEALG